MDLRNMRALMIRMGMKDFAVKLSHSGFARFLQGLNYSYSLMGHKKELQKVRDILADEFSRETFDAVIHASRTGNYSMMKKFNVRPQYFLKDIMPVKDTEIYVDGGGYDGNDALFFLKNYITEGRGRAYIWEPDSKNAERISKTLQGFDSYEVKPFALWSRKEQLHFSGTGSVISQLSKYGNITVEADSIDNQHGHEQITFIKMDIEGAEPEALRGAERTIKKYKPKLAICIYHQPSHLYEIPLWIKSKVPEYKIYIRHHSNSLAETVCYAVV